MIYKDDYGLPVDKTGDGGDSAVRAGILAVTKHPWAVECNCYVKTIINNIANYYFKSPGFCSRHPDQYPWHNYNNFTRDQLIPLIAGLYAQGEHKIIKQIFYTHLKRFFFTQSIERDKHHSRKYLWPHDFYKDSVPTPITYLRGFNWRKFRFEKTIPDIGYETEYRFADYRDYLLPNIVGMMIKGGRVYWAYPYLIVCFMFHILNLAKSAINPGKEVNQLFGECSVYGTLKTFDSWVRWIPVNYEYWNKRNEIEYHNAMMAHLVRLYG
jgi:hypothetical protein